jgi:hypothetical protein
VEATAEAAATRKRVDPERVRHTQTRHLLCCHYSPTSTYHYYYYYYFLISAANGTAAAAVAASVDAVARVGIRRGSTIPTSV